METETPFITQDETAILARPRLVASPIGDLCLPRGYRWNGANIPRALRWLFGTPFDAVHAMPSAEHDLLYTIGAGTRAAADAHYYRGIRARGQWWPLAVLEWLNIRLFGGRYWEGL